MLDLGVRTEKSYAIGIYSAFKMISFHIKYMTNIVKGNSVKLQYKICFLFVWVFFVPIENLSIIWRRSKIFNER